MLKTSKNDRRAQQDYLPEIWQFTLQGFGCDAVELFKGRKAAGGVGAGYLSR